MRPTISKAQTLQTLQTLLQLQIRMRMLEAVLFLARGL